MFLQVDLKCQVLPASGGIFLLVFLGEGISLFRPTWYDFLGGVGGFRAGIIFFQYFQAGKLEAFV